jgi:hypothetical protein
MFWADPRFYWRNLQEIARPGADNPPPQEAYYEYVPVPSRVLPERVIEFPYVSDLAEDIKQLIYEWEDRNLGPDAMHQYEYEAHLSVACGTKVGGYIRWIQFPWEPFCECGRRMEHLLTIASTEWDGLIDQRWTPVEEYEKLGSFSHRSEDVDEEKIIVWGALREPTGLCLGDLGDMKLFICRHCGKWPILPYIECS